MANRILESLQIAFYKYLSEPALLGGSIVFAISVAGNIYQYNDKKTELARIESQHETSLQKMRAEIEKLSLESQGLKRNLATQESNAAAHGAEIASLKNDIASDEQFLTKQMMEKVLIEQKIAAYERDPARQFSLQAERQNLELTVGEIKRLEADKAQRAERIKFLEGLLNK
jgi:predicted RNase H-like nuclease (RuvC/YqgF family)